MKAEDTVMNFKQMNLLRSTPAVAEAQAEISFPLGKQEGMQEVVEFAETEIFEVHADIESGRPFLTLRQSGVSCLEGMKWQAFLKERGLGHRVVRMDSPVIGKRKAKEEELEK